MYEETKGTLGEKFLLEVTKVDSLGLDYEAWNVVSGAHSGNHGICSHWPTEMALASLQWLAYY